MGSSDALSTLVCEDRAGVCKSKQGVVGEDGTESHCSGVEDGFMTETAQAAVPMHNLYLLTNHNVPEDGEEGKDGWHGRFAVNDEEGDMVDLETVRQITHTGPAFVRMRHDYHFVSAINEFLHLSRFIRHNTGSMVRFVAWLRIPSSQLTEDT
ncbi:hypothetical protein McanMca71_005364 [Microsporum canis]